MTDTEQKALALLNEVRNLLDYDQNTGAFTWKVGRAGSKGVGSIAGEVNSRGYVRLCVNGWRPTGHRLAWLLTYGEWPEGNIDHINGDRADNRIANLRVVSSLVNSQNRHRAARTNKTTGLLGASFDRKREKYVARIRHNGRVITIGRYGTAEAAHAAYLDVKRQIHEGCTI